MKPHNRVSAVVVIIYAIIAAMVMGSLDLSTPPQALCIFGICCISGAASIAIDEWGHR